MGNIRRFESLPLPNDEVHIWFTPYERITDSGLLGLYRQLLNGDELAKMARFHYETDRLRYLVTRVLVRTVLSRYVDVAPTDWIFASNNYGRPEPTNREAQVAGVVFSISHSDSLIVLGVAKDRAIGIDVENVSSRQAPIDVADTYFGPTEMVALSFLPPAEQEKRFYEYWTLKESYTKALGLGLSIPLDKVDFRFTSDSEVHLNLHQDLADDPQRWRFWQLSVLGDYVVAVCAEKKYPGPIGLRLMQVLPLGAEEALFPVVLRMSA